MITIIMVVVVVVVVVLVVVVVAVVVVAGSSTVPYLHSERTRVAAKIRLIKISTSIKVKILIEF